MSENKAHFTERTIRQERKDGTVKYRTLMVPSEETMKRHRTMLQFLYSLAIPMPYATGAIPGKDLLDNVRPHRQSNSFYKLDLKNAFPSVDKVELGRIAQKPIIPKRHQSEVVHFIESWGTHPEIPGLPLGAPTSPFLFNMYCLPMDRKLGAYCMDNGIIYTRYLDDLTFSVPDRLGKIRRKQLNSLIESQPGMVINHPKSRVHNLDVGPVTITGISLYPDRRLGASPWLLETAHQTFEQVALDVNNGVPVLDEDIGRLHGYHGAIHQLTPGETPTTRRLDRAYFNALGRLGLLDD